MFHKSLYTESDENAIIKFETNSYKLKVRKQDIFISSKYCLLWNNTNVVILSFKLVIYISKSDERNVKTSKSN